MYISIATPENEVKAIVEKANKNSKKKYKYKKVKTTIGYMWEVK